MDEKHTTTLIVNDLSISLAAERKKSMSSPNLLKVVLRRFGCRFLFFALLNGIALNLSVVAAFLIKTYIDALSSGRDSL